MTKALILPMSEDVARSLRAGDEVTLSGTVYTGRDQACRRLFTMINDDETPPVDLNGQLLYFVGPTPAPDHHVIGSAGPTTSSRMNSFLPTLIDHGLRGFIGKGFIAEMVKRRLEERGGIYFGAIGGTGALLSKSIVEATVVGFSDLLSEAIHRLELFEFPAVVLHDTRGGDVYEQSYGNS